MSELDIFIQRMKSIGINIKLISNIPWIYIKEINGRIVTEKFQANHGFTIGWHPRSKDEKFMFTDIKEIFKLIRKYIKPRVR